MYRTKHTLGVTHWHNHHKTHQNIITVFSIFHPAVMLWCISSGPCTCLKCESVTMEYVPTVRAIENFPSLLFFYYRCLRIEAGITFKELLAFKNFEDV